VLGALVYAAGTAVDQNWHAHHASFEGGADQVQAHTVLWLGGLITLVAAAWAVAARTRNRGYRVVLGSSIAFAVVQAWHFWEHYYHHDPAAPHVAIALTAASLLVGMIWVVFGARRPARAT